MSINPTIFINFITLIHVYNCIIHGFTCGVSFITINNRQTGVKFIE